MILTLKTVVKWGGPKPGHEMQYYLATKHRYIASKWMLRLQRKICCGWAKYNQAHKLWVDALIRQAEHGEDLILNWESDDGMGTEKQAADGTPEGRKQETDSAQKE